MATLERRFELDEHVALRPEPFGAVAYHHRTRRLVFLRDPELVTVVRSLADHPDLAAVLRGCAIAERRWSSFVAAIDSLARSGIVREHPIAA